MSEQDLEQEELSQFDEIEQEELSNSNDNDDASSIEQELNNSSQNNDPEENSDSNSDDTNKEENEGSNSWGKNKYNYYYQEKMQSDSELEEEEVAEAEEMQNKLNERLEFDDFFDGIDIKKRTEENNLALDEKKIFQEKSNQQTATIDLKNFTEEEKIEFLARDSPELVSLISESSQIIKDLREFYQPLFENLSKLNIKNKNLVLFVKQKRKLLLTYYQSLMFYVLLKAKNILTKDHPILNQIIKLKEKNEELGACEQIFETELIGIRKKLKEINDNPEKQIVKAPKKLKMSVQAGNQENNQKNIQKHEEKKNFRKKQLAKILNLVEEKQEEERFNRNKESKLKKRVPEINFNEFDDEFSDEGIDFDNIQLDKTEKTKKTPLQKKQRNQQQQQKQRLPNINSEKGKFYQMEVKENLSDNPRKIDQEILTHRGLIRKRKKIDRNSRVKLRQKFQKASVKQKYLGKVIRKRKPHYEGELTGIKSNLVKGVTLKN